MMDSVRAMLLLVLSIGLLLVIGGTVAVAQEQLFSYRCNLSKYNAVSNYDPFVHSVVDSLAKRTSGEPQRDYRDFDFDAVGVANVWGHAYCSLGIAQDDCSSCLDGAAKMVYEYCAKAIGAAAWNDNCQLRYEIYQI